MTRKTIKRYISAGIAQDITRFGFEEAEELRQQHNLEIVAVSHGINGMNGALLKDEDGKMYAIASRNSTLFQLV